MSVPAVNPFVSIVIPCFNEGDTIVRTIESVRAYLIGQYPQTSFEIVTVDDGSTDDSPAIVSRLALSDTRIRPVYFPFNRGRGQAVVAGIRHTKGTYVVCLDADLSYDVDHIGDILRHFQGDPKLDVVVLSPYMRGGSVRGVPWFRLALSRTANLILAGAFSNGLSTVTSVVRGYRGSVVRSLPLFESQKELHLEILRKLTICGAKIVEIPGRLHWKNEKGKKRRKTNWSILHTAKRHLLYGFLIKPTRVFKLMTALLFFVGIDEVIAISIDVTSRFELIEGGFLHSLWTALSHSYSHSPHSFVIAGVSLMLGAQAFTLLAILQVLKLQQEETMRHVVAVLQRFEPFPYQDSTV